MLTEKEVLGSWNPKEKNDSIEGELLMIEEEVKVKDYTYKGYILETANNIQEVLGSAVLDSKMRMIKVGDRVKIRYLGEEQSGKGQSYKKFKVCKIV